MVGKVGSTTVVQPFAVTITSANNWTKTVSGLAQKHAGQTITYSIQSENAVSGYTPSISGLTVTNTHTPATTSITLTKNWSDGNNQDGIRPSSVTVNVVGKVGSTTVVQPFAVTITSSENWTKTVSGLAQKHAGQTITYSIQSENAISGYTASISGLTVTNTHTPATTSITLIKTWADDENRLGLRPADVTVTVTGTAGGETVFTQDYTLTASGNWQLQVNGLDKYAAGNEIVYAIASEEPVENYTAQINGLTVTNTLDDIPPVSFDLEAELVIGGVGLEWPEAPEVSVYEIWRKTAGGEFEKIGETSEKNYADLTVDVLTTYEYQIRILNGESDVEEIATGRFLDVLPSDAYNKAVNWAVENAIVNGTGPTTFSPSAACTRAQFALMLYRMAGKPEVDMSVNPFTDLPNNSGIRKAIVWAYSEGIVNGTSATTYSPDNNITRAQLVIMLYKMAGKPSVEGLSCPFEDLEGLTANNVKAIIWAYNENIVKGTSATTFSPRANCTRGQLVIMLYRYNRLMGLVPTDTGPAATAQERIGSFREA